MHEESAARRIVRSWKEEGYRDGLGWEERARLPEDPAGRLQVTDPELGGAFAAGAEWEDKSLVGCNSLIAHCPGTLGTLCSFWGCPSSDWTGCSLFGCLVGNLPEC